MLNKKKETLIGYAFLAPSLAIFATFLIFPLFFSIFLAFCDWNFLSGWDGLKFVCFDNFKELFQDKSFISAVKNVFIYALATIPASILIALILAVQLNKHVYARKVLRFVYFVPYVISIVAVASVFKFLFREDGIINTALYNVLGLPRINWIGDQSFNKIPVIMVIIWTGLGFQLIIYLAALQNIPRELYEAAELDNANGWQRFWHIIFPLISPSTFFLIIIRLIDVFKMFASVNILSLSLRYDSNTSIVAELYQYAFGYYKFGYASAMAFVLLILISLVTFINFGLQKKWVHY